MLHWQPIRNYKRVCDAGEVVLTDAGLGFIDTHGGLDDWAVSDIHGKRITVNDKYGASFMADPTRFARLNAARKDMREAF